MALVIGYVGTSDLAGMLEEDIVKFDVINIAFGHIRWWLECRWFL